MILDEQTNKVFISEQTKAQHPRITQRLLDAMDAKAVDWQLLAHTNDSWCRDYMPIQISPNKFVQYRYYPDYLNNDENREWITDPTLALKSLGIETVKTNIVMDGGNVIKCKDKVIMMDKVFRENPDYNPTALVDELESLFESEIVFLPWDKYEKYGHADGVVRYVSEHKVLMTNYHDFDPKMADKFLHILSKHFEVQTLEYDTAKPHDMSWAYINFLQTKKAIFVPIFRREEDVQALAQIERAFPSYTGNVVPVALTGIANDGGAINCITWNIFMQEANTIDYTPVKE